MSHDLTTRYGHADMFSVRKTPWHQLGTVLDDAPSLPDALRLGGLDFTVRKRRWPLVGKAYRTVRTDTGWVLGEVGREYEVVQNVEAFRVFEPLLDQGVMTLETGGSLRRGAEVWLCARFDLRRFGPMTREVFTDEVLPYAVIGNTFDGSRGAYLLLSPIRPVCANTLAIGTRFSKRYVQVDHRVGAAARLADTAAEVFGVVVDGFEEAARRYRKLKDILLDEHEFDALMERLLGPVAPSGTSGTPGVERLLAKYLGRRYLGMRVMEAALAARSDELKRLWREGRGHTGDGSAWEAFNGIVEAVDHNESGLFPRLAGEERLDSLLHGEAARFKERALQLLVQHARIRGRTGRTGHHGPAPRQPAAPAAIGSPSPAELMV